MADRPKIESQGGLTCLYVGCKAKGDLTFYPSDSGFGVEWDEKGWLFWAAGYPSQSKNYGVCKDHQAIKLELEPSDSIEIRLGQDTHGVFYELSAIEEPKMRKGAFPTSTLQWTWAPDTVVTPRLGLAAERVSELYGFKQPANVVDELLAPEAKWEIVSNGLLQPIEGKQVSLRPTYWVTEVEYTRGDGHRTRVRLTLSQMTEWRKRG